MAKLQRIKLTRLERSELQEREMKNLVGGQSCGCGCHYVYSEGSISSDNRDANFKYGYSSYGGSSDCSILYPDGSVAWMPHN